MVNNTIKTNFGIINLQATTLSQSFLSCQLAANSTALCRYAKLGLLGRKPFHYSYQGRKGLFEWLLNTKKRAFFHPKSFNSALFSVSSVTAVFERIDIDQT